ncbi:MAG TPA: hypothetical protein VGM18_00425 [Candidatus Sulfotelmatobacter sp.]
MSDPIVPEQLAFDQLLFGQIASEPVVFGAMPPDHAVPELLISEAASQPLVSDQGDSHKAVSEPVASEPVVPEQAAPEQFPPNEVVSEPVKSGKENKAAARPFRVKLRGSVLALVRLPNRRSVRAAIHQLSTSGGVVHLEKPLDEKLEVELIFHIRKATIRGKAQMLFPMWATQGWMQPFRFVNLAADSREKLDEKLKSFLGETVNAAAAGV